MKQGTGRGTITQVGNKWRARFSAPDGSGLRESRTFDDLDDAELWIASKRIEVKRGVWSAPRPPAPPFDRYAREWIDTRRNRHGRPLKPRTAALYRRTVDTDLAEFARTHLDAITPDRVRAWFAGMDDRPAAQANAYGLLAAIMGTATADGILDRSPCRIRGGTTKDRAGQTVVLDHTEVVALADAMPMNYRATVYLAAYGGLRQGELFALRRRDVDPEGGWVAVQRAVTHTRGEVHIGTPKSAAGQRVVTLPPHVAPLIAEHLLLWTVDDPDALVFTSSRGNALRASTLYRHFYPAREAIGRPDLRFHDLRHTGATMAAHAGATLRELQARLGHSTIQAAMVYQHATQDRDRVIAEQISAQAATPARRLRVVNGDQT